MAEKTDREAVKVLAIAVGVREAARQLGLNEERVLKWSQRGHWFKQPEALPLPPTITKNDVLTVRKPSDVLRESLDDDNRVTKLGLSKATRKASKVLAEADGDFVLAKSEDLRRIVSSAAQIHNWEKEEEGSGTLSGLRVYSKQTIMNVQVAPAQPTDSGSHRETGDPSAP